MSQNPYAAYNTGEPAPEARTSVLAIGSLVCSLICCIPGLSIIGTLLGAVAILRISASNGRRKGVGLAIAGIVIGLAISVCYIGAYAFMTVGIKQMMGVGTVVIETLPTADPSALRQKLPAEAAARLPDAQWRAFRDQIEAEIGTPEALPNNPISYFSQVFSAFGQYGRASNGRRQQNMQSSLPPIPLKGAKGTGVMMVELAGDPTSDINHNLSILEQITVFTSSGKTIKLFLAPGETAPALPETPGGTPTPLPPSAPAPPAPPAPTPSGV
ncbi:MAG TPA: DUF4190 domain-containing protein [Phycisphaerales bacterium]|nr:DUF4190 domain-containing protein [Phycisphaerales bacterium]